MLYVETSERRATTRWWQCVATNDATGQRRGRETRPETWGRHLEEAVFTDSDRRDPPTRDALLHPDEEPTRRTQSTGFHPYAGELDLPPEQIQARLYFFAIAKLNTCCKINHHLAAICSIQPWYFATPQEAANFFLEVLPDHRLASLDSSTACAA